MTSYLCKCIGVSKSGYYNYLKNENKRSVKKKNKNIMGYINLYNIVGNVCI